MKNYNAFLNMLHNQRFRVAVMDGHGRIITSGSNPSVSAIFANSSTLPAGDLAELLVPR